MVKKLFLIVLFVALASFTNAAQELDGDADGKVDPSLLPTATDSAQGAVELATDAETVTGSATNRAVTPANVTARLAAPGTIGGTTPGPGTFTTLGAGSGGFSVDADGDTTVKSLTVTRTAGVASYSDFYEIPANGDNYVRLKPADSLGGDYTVTLPSATGTLPVEGAATGGVILGDSTPDAEGEFGYASNQLSIHDGTASRSLLQVASTVITKSEYLPIRYAEADDSVTAPADAAEISTTTAIGRAFDAATEEGVVFWWDVPLDYSAGIKFQVVYALMADASADNTVVFGLSGCSVGNSEAIACSEGTAVTKADELGTDDDQYQIMISDWSDAVTVTGIAAGEIAKLLFYRDADAVADDYGSDVAVIGVRIKYQAKVNASTDY